MAAKKGSKTKAALRSLETTPDKAFHMINGKMITKLSDLSNEIESSDEQTFYYHVNDQKNDFANWIKDVFNNSNLATKIDKARTKNELVSVLKSQIK
ncbi:MAG: hypothetical protein KKA19_08525 [Candidatus Margulisbacteria bacterium]|nr:hypothetical protein [Candidatus Margulisiibacteriota bacterium]